MNLGDGTREVGLDFPREWVEFVDPDDADHVIRADLTWLLSGWTCVFGRGCPGIVEGRAQDGCCTHGAFFTDDDDRRRVRAAAKSLTRETWQHYRGSFKQATELDTVDGTEPALRTATRPDGPCVFLNDADFPGGGGCALHAKALRDGVHPMRYKPDVCWQLPIRREQTWTTRADGTKVLVSTVSEFDRRGWGEGGHDLQWWCTGSPLAHVGRSPLYQEYAEELSELIGRAAYGVLVGFAERRRELGLVAPHPAGTGPVTGGRVADAAAV